MFSALVWLSSLKIRKYGYEGIACPHHRAGLVHSVISLSTLLTVLQSSISVVVLWPQELVALWEEESARTLGVLDVDG